MPVLLGNTAGQASNSTITVDYTTNPGTAQPNTDYLTTNGTLTFTPGETAKQVKKCETDADDLRLILIQELDKTFVTPLDRDDIHRLITRRTRLYTVMITSGALVHGDVGKHLDFDAAEHPVALQLGGADPTMLAEAARVGESYGYDEVNLNVGCPSDRVQAGRASPQPTDNLSQPVASPQSGLAGVYARVAPMAPLVFRKHRLSMISSWPDGRSCRWRWRWRPCPPRDRTSSSCG